MSLSKLPQIWLAVFLMVGLNVTSAEPAAAQEFVIGRFYSRPLVLGSATRTCPPSGYKVIGGGVEAFDAGGSTSGNIYIKDSYPDNNCWVVTMDQNIQTGYGPYTVWVYAVYDPSDKWDVAVFARTGSSSHPASAVVSLPTNSNYVMTGGGARYNWLSGEPRAFLTASFPENGQTWRVEGKDHLTAGPGALYSAVTSFVIGIKPRSGPNLSGCMRVSDVSAPQPYPRMAVLAPDDCVITSGGAKLLWQEPGSLLRGSWPNPNASTWNVIGKEDAVASPARIQATVIGIIATNVSLHQQPPKLVQAVAASVR